MMDHTHLPGGAAALALVDPALSEAVAVVTGPCGSLVRFASEVAGRRVEYDGIVEMLLEHATPGAEPKCTDAVAAAIAAGCLGERHLWRDLQLPDRRSLRLLLEAYFEPFAADNYMDMRWKKFIYRRLCRWGGFNTCKAPSCGVCSSYEECFGREA